MSFAFQLQRRILDSYEKGKLIPLFHLKLKLKDKTNPQALEQAIDFIGVKEPTSMLISREPIPEGLHTNLEGYYYMSNFLLPGPLPPVGGINKQQAKPPLSK